MKRVGYLFDKVYDIENCKQAIRNAAKSKRKKCRKYLDNIDYYAMNLSWLIKSKSYVPAPYRKFILRDGLSKKEREISTTKFYPDQCVYWALLQVTGDILRRGVYKYSCAGIKGRGTLYASRRVRKWVETDAKYTKYCLKIDIKQFYPSIDNEVLKRLIRRLIKDPDVLKIFDDIIDLEEGIPIGTVLSPYFADVMLQSLDYLIKQKLRDFCKYHIRYADDMCIFGNNKKNLRKVLDAIVQHLKSIGLTLKGNYQIFLVERIEKKGKNKGKRHGRRVDFCGWSTSHVNTRIRKRIALRIIRTCRKIAAGRYTYKLCARLIAYTGWIKYSCSNALKQTYIYHKISMNKVKGVIRNETYKRNNRERAALVGSQSVFA